jgi:hypothetical protein
VASHAVATPATPGSVFTVIFAKVTVASHAMATPAAMATPGLVFTVILRGASRR